MSDNVQLVSLPWNMRVNQESLTWTLFKKHVSITSAWWRNVARTQRGPKLRANVGRNLGPVDMENLRFFAEGFHFSQLNWLARSFGPPMHEFPCLFFFIGGFVRFGNEIRRAWLIGLSPTFQANYEIRLDTSMCFKKTKTIIFHRFFFTGNQTPESSDFVRKNIKKHLFSLFFSSRGIGAASDLSFKRVGEWSFETQDIFIVWVDPDELGDPTKPQEKLVGKKRGGGVFKQNRPGN